MALVFGRGKVAGALALRDGRRRSPRLGASGPGRSARPPAAGRSRSPFSGTRPRRGRSPGASRGAALPGPPEQPAASPAPRGVAAVTPAAKRNQLWARPALQSSAGTGGGRLRPLRSSRRLGSLPLLPKQHLDRKLLQQQFPPQPLLREPS